MKSFNCGGGGGEMSLGLFENVIYKMFLQILYIHMYAEDLALNNLQWLICHRT